MSKSILILLVSFVSSPVFADATEDLIVQAEKALPFGTLEARSLINSLSDKDAKTCHSKDMGSGQATGRCGIGLMPSEPRMGDDQASANPSNRIIQNSPQFFIFVSESMPQNSIKALGEELGSRKGR